MKLKAKSRNALADRYFGARKNAPAKKILVKATKGLRRVK